MTKKKRIPWNKGKTNVYSEETLKKNSDAHKISYEKKFGKERALEIRTKISESMKQRKLTKKHKKNISIQIKKKYKKPKDITHKDSWRHTKPEPSKKITYLFETPNGDKTKDTTFSSIWSYRGYKKTSITEDPIHNIDSVNNLRTKNGKNYYSKFSPLTAECIINYWSNPGDTILDPFSGRTRAIVSSLKERHYIGFEVSKNVADIMQQKIDKGIIDKELDKEYPPKLINDDCVNIDKHDIPEIDLLFTCPPYFNLEKYESCEGQLSDINDYSVFLQQLKERLSKSCDLLKPEGYAAIVIGDFRMNKKFYMLHHEVLNIMQQLNMLVHDIIILQTVTWDVAAYRFGSLKKSKKVSKVHEYLLIFKKP